MGLAGPKNRFKISHDPNNTTWSRNTDRFGHKILTAQGWTPGSHLGNQTSAHAAHHTAASFAHVKVLLKDDNLGLGAKRGSERAENFGMAGFDDLLARLNGKSEEKILEKKGERRDKELKVFVSQRWGTMVFVSGGLLVGDQIVKKGEAEQGDGVEAKKEKKDKKDKKRKRDENSDGTPLDTIDEDPEPSLKKKKRKSNLRGLIDPTSPPAEDPKPAKKDKKSKKSDPTTSPPDSSEQPLTKEARKAARRAEKAARKEAKAARKEAKAKRKADKEARRSGKSSALPTPAESASSDSDSSEDETDTAATGAASAPAAPLSGGVAAFANSARHNARRRYIMAKRSAVMDPQALREIFMIKGQ